MALIKNDKINYKNEISYSKEDLKILFEESPFAIILTDEEATILQINKKTEEITGYKRDELIGKKTTIFKSDKTDFGIYFDLWNTLKNGNIWNGEIINKKKDGKEYWARITINPIKDNDNLIVKYISVMEDISVKKSYEQVKERVERILRHDLKTPLLSIINFPDYLLLDDNLTKEQKMCLKHIKESGEYMLSQINQSLYLYKLEESNYQIKNREFNIFDTIGKILIDLSFIGKEREVGVNIFLNDEEVDPINSNFLIRSDKNLIYRMLSNLVKNAVEASPKNRTVSIKVYNEDKFVIIIHNFGAIPKEIRLHFFEKYITSKKYGGNGLGTYSSKLIADLLKIKLSFDTDEKKGTFIKVDFGEVLV